ncbi:MAG: outer membrane beta-barrel protein [Candidatus Aminicenantes bacterium]|nr:outer membrane beta-barrel protein [Candidatus Aminicenantes bacterium]
MKKIIFAIFVIFVFLAAAAFADAAVIKVKVTTANVRQQPDATSAVISRAALGTLFEVIKKTGNWFEIAVTDATGKTVTGFINADVVEEIGAPGAPAQPQRTAAAPAYAAPRAAAKAGGFFFGLGPVLSNQSYDSNTDSGMSAMGITKSMRFGFQIGAGYEYPLGGNLAVMPGLLFSTAGNVLNGEGGKATVALSGLIIPMDVKYGFNGLFVAGGPYFGLILSAKTVTSEGGSTDIMDDLNKFHFGLSLGAGYEMNLSGMNFLIKLAYQLGLSKLNKSMGSDDTGSMKHNAITILAAIKI